MKLFNATPVTAADTSDHTNIDLQLLGVPPDWVDLQPTATRFPQSFSKESNQVWTKMFDNADLVSKIRKEKDIPAQWKKALNLFTDQCELKGVAPFSSQRNRVDNSSLISFLKTSRLRLTQFLDDTKMLETLRIIRGSQERRYETGFSKFSVRCSASVKSPFRSIEDLAIFLNGYRFAREPNNTFKKIITANLVIYIVAPSPNRVKIVYQIQGCQSVYLGSKYAIPTKKQVHNFCDTVIFLPIVRAHRIKALGTHTLF